jgi:hypothetical protein
MCISQTCENWSFQLELESSTVLRFALRGNSIVRQFG